MLLLCVPRATGNLPVARGAHRRRAGAGQLPGLALGLPKSCIFIQVAHMKMQEFGSQPPRYVKALLLVLGRFSKRPSAARAILRAHSTWEPLMDPIASIWASLPMVHLNRTHPSPWKQGFPHKSRQQAANNLPSEAPVASKLPVSKDHTFLTWAPAWLVAVGQANSREANGISAPALATTSCACYSFKPPG